MRFVQFTRFGMPEARRPALLEARRTALASCRALHPELCGTFLVRLEGGDWLDVAVWAGQAGESAPPAPLPPPGARAEFFDQIDELIGEECGLVVDDHVDACLFPADCSIR